MTTFHYRDCTLYRWQACQAMLEKQICLIGFQNLAAIATGPSLAKGARR
jgi:hypothetical protein